MRNIEFETQLRVYSGSRGSLKVVIDKELKNVLVHHVIPGFGTKLANATYDCALRYKMLIGAFGNEKDDYKLKNSEIRWLESLRPKIKEYLYG